MTRALIPTSLCLAVILAGESVHAQTALGGAGGSPALAALRDSPQLGVQDHAGLFHAEAVVKARAEIHQFRQDFHRDLFIETFEHVPEADQKQIRTLWLPQSEHYFVRWATTRAQTIGVDGIYILICKAPKHIQVLVYPNTPEQGFTEDNVRELRKLLERELAQTPDAALADAVALVRKDVKENLANHESAANSISFGTVALVIAAIVGFWLLLSLVRGILPGTGNDPGHVGLKAGFLGALFGTAAGYWIYDRLFRGHSPAEARPETDFLHGPPPAEPPLEPRASEESATWS